MSYGLKLHVRPMTLSVLSWSFQFGSFAQETGLEVSSELLLATSRLSSATMDEFANMTNLPDAKEVQHSQPIHLLNSNSRPAANGFPAKTIARSLPKPYQ